MLITNALIIGFLAGLLIFQVLLILIVNDIHSTLIVIRMMISQIIKDKKK